MGSLIKKILSFFSSKKSNVESDFVVESEIYSESKKEVVNDFVEDEKPCECGQKELIDAIGLLVKEESLDLVVVKDFIARSFRNGRFEEEGTAIEDIVPISRTNRETSLTKQARVTVKLKDIYNKFKGHELDIDSWILS